MRKAIHTSNPHLFKRLWTANGGAILEIRGTGEVRYAHPALGKTVRANDRRKDVPAVLLSRLNQLLKMNAANDKQYKAEGGARHVPINLNRPGFRGGWLV